jgi:hypothetical protein
MFRRIKRQINSLRVRGILRNNPITTRDIMTIRDGRRNRNPGLMKSIMMTA